MSINSGENEQGFKKIIDMTRLISVVVLLLHCYYNCYTAFAQWNLTSNISRSN